MLNNAAKSSAPADSRDEALRQAQIDISQCLADWIATINEGTVDAVTALYAPKAVLLGTFEAKVLTTPVERKNYFTSFMARKNLHATVDESFINALDDNAGEASGLYTFAFTDKTGAPQAVRARFLFVYARQSEGDWLIAAHHSSVVPNS